MIESNEKMLLNLTDNFVARSQKKKNNNSSNRLSKPKYEQLG